MQLKKIIFILILSWVSSSCEKYSIPEIPDRPAWLNEKISDFTESDAFGYRIVLYSWSGAYYYHIESLISSCVFCEFYTYEGEKYIWAPGEMDDFFKKGQRIGVIWAGPPYSDTNKKSSHKDPYFRLGLIGLEEGQ